MNQEFAIYEPISLGFSCEVKYQLSRRLFLNKFPDGNDFDFRRTLLTAAYGERDFERHLFDWQITPFPALLAYLEQDFQGVFEKDDLIIDETHIVHRRLKTRHPHDFHGDNGVLEGVVEGQFAQARAKFDYLAQKFRMLLSRPGPFLYVVRTTPSHGDASRLRELLQRNPGHRFELLFIGWEDGLPEPDLKGVAHWAFAAIESDKSPGREWEGDDGAWDRVLRSWPLSIPVR